MTRAASDVVVVGAGTMGAWTALRTQRAGWSTTLIDAFGAGHPRATSGDDTRILRASHGADTFYTRWSREARSAWQAFGDEVGERFFVEAGMLWFARREDGFEAHSIATLVSLGLADEVILFRAPVVVGPDGVRALAGHALSAVERSPRYHLVEDAVYGEDRLRRYLRTA